MRTTACAYFAMIVSTASVAPAELPKLVGEVILRKAPSESFSFPWTSRLSPDGQFLLTTRRISAEQTASPESVDGKSRPGHAYHLVLRQWKTGREKAIPIPLSADVDDLCGLYGGDIVAISMNPFSADGKLLVVPAGIDENGDGRAARDEKIEPAVYDIESGKLRRIGVQGAHVYSTFDAAGKHLIFTVFEKGNWAGMTYIAPVETLRPKPLASWGLPLAPRPGHTTFAFGELQAKVVLYDYLNDTRATGQPFRDRKPSAPFSTLQWTANGRYLYCTDGPRGLTTWVWDMQEARLVERLPDFHIVGPCGGPTTMVLSEYLWSPAVLHNAETGSLEPLSESTPIHAVCTAGKYLLYERKTSQGYVLCRAEIEVGQSAGRRESRATDSPGMVAVRGPSIDQKLKIVPPAAKSLCTVLHFLSDTKLLASHRRSGPGIWDAATGRLVRKLSISAESESPCLTYVTPDGALGAGRAWFQQNGSKQQFQVWDLARDRQFVVNGPNMEGSAHYLFITRDKKTLWATCSANPLSGAFNQLRFKITGTAPLAIDFQSKGKSGQEGVPHYHCATENLLIYFLETGSEAKGMTLCVWDLETLPQSSPRTLILNGHTPKSFWRMYERRVARPERPPVRHKWRVEVNGVLEDRYAHPAYKVYACLAVPRRSELYVLVPYSKKPLGDSEGLRLTVIDTREALKEKRSFDLPLLKIEGMALHPKRPILFCVTNDDRLLVIDTVSGAIAKEVRLKDKVSFLRYVRIAPAVSPDGRLIAIGNADGTISILEFSE